MTIDRSEPTPTPACWPATSRPAVPRSIYGAGERHYGRYNPKPPGRLDEVSQYAPLPLHTPNVSLPVQYSYSAGGGISEHIGNVRNRNRKLRRRNSNRTLRREVRNRKLRRYWQHLSHHHVPGPCCVNRSSYKHTQAQTLASLQAKVSMQLSHDPCQNLKQKVALPRPCTAILSQCSRQESSNMGDDVTLMDQPRYFVCIFTPPRQVRLPQCHLFRPAYLDCGPLSTFRVC